MTQRQGENTSLQDLWSLLLRHKRGMFVVFLGTIIVVMLWTFLQTPVYEVNSQLMVRYGREYIYRPADLLLKGDVQPLLNFNREEIINTEIQILKSKGLIAKVIKAIGVNNLYPKIDKSESDPEKKLGLAIERFQKDLTVTHIKGSGVLTITFAHSDPELGVRAVSSLENLFKSRHLELFKNPRISFLESQLEVYKQKLLASKKKLEDYKRQNHIIALEDQKRLLLDEYAQVQTMLIKGKGHLKELEEKIVSLKKQLNAIPSRVTLFSEKAQENNVDTARARLLALQLQEHDLLQKYNENNRLVKAVREKIKMVKRFLNSQAASSVENTRSGENLVYQQLKRQLIEARAERDAQLAQNNALAGQLRQIEEQLEDYSSKEPVLNMLKQAVDIHEQSYKNFIDRLEEARILDAMNSQKMVSVTVLEEPMKPVKPAKPRKKLNFLVGIILGAALSLMYAFFIDYFVPQKQY